MKSLKLLSCIVFMPFIAYCWNAQGHNTCGAIAYYYLKANDPVVLGKVVATLKAHPWYSTEWAQRIAGISPGNKDLALFMLASTFPDEARKDDKYGGPVHAVWHYVDYPYVPEGQKVKGEEPHVPNAEVKIIGLSDSLMMVKDPAEQAVGLCWIFHLIEDVHQPLHAASMFSDVFPEGDKGGNSVKVTFGAAKPEALHHYWDGLVSKDLAFNDIPAAAEKLYKEPKYKLTALHELKEHTAVHQWTYVESYPLAISAAYKNGKVNGTEMSPTQLDNAYAQNAMTVGERRLVLSSIRLAQKLEEIYKYK